MGSEVAQYISGLNVNWPTPTDKVREGDDHLRTIKTALVNTFPNIAGAVELTHDELNNLLLQIPALISHIFPTGGIIAWSGAANAIPVGWALCDGTLGTPNLRGRFILGAGGTYVVGATGGAESVTSAETEIVGITVGNHTLTAAEMPAHTHFIVANEDGTGGITNANQVMVFGSPSGNDDYHLQGTATAATIGKTSSAGSSGAHSHPLDGDTTHTHAVAVLPPYYALCWIMKTAAWIL